MKSNELMVGDWLQGFLPGVYSRVAGILNEYRVAVWADRAYIELSIDDLKPVPVTPEILVGNGFSVDGKDYVYRVATGCVCVVLDNMVEMYIESRMPGNGCDDKRAAHRYSPGALYVHELQHALRLCGIEKEIVL